MRLERTGARVAAIAGIGIVGAALWYVASWIAGPERAFSYLVGILLGLLTLLALVWMTRRQ